MPSTFLGEDTYEYDSTWKDKLIKYNGENITYDALGNPLSYRDGMSFEWVRGRLLDSVTVNETEIEMKYDSNGMRTQKGDVHYYYDSNNNLIALVNSFSTLFFYYDENGSPVSFSYNGIGMYYYVKNLQGDIVKIVNKDGQVVASYEYNAWGEILSIKNYYGSNVTDPNHIGLLNPFRYRGYVYDDETGLYYLQSRYYDPITCRFLNADVYCDTESGSPLSTNMFSYCENNAILRVDINGNWYYTLSDYAYYRDNTYRTYQHFDAYYSIDPWYRQMSISYGQQYALANSRYRFISEHYKNNLKKVSKFNTYIYGQGNSPYSNFIFGASTVADSGCGSVALFNVMFKLGYITHLAQIILEMELNNMLLNNGDGGTSNKTFPNFLRAHSIKYVTYDRLFSFISNVGKYRISMVIKTGHIFCVMKIGKNVYAINRYNSDKGFRKINLDSLYYSFIIAYGIK